MLRITANIHSFRFRSPRVVIYHALQKSEFWRHCPAVAWDHIVFQRRVVVRLLF